MRWIYDSRPAGEVEAFATQADVTPVVAELLLRNGFSKPESAAHFLHPKLADLNDPFKLPHLEEAVRRFCKAIAEKESIVILGDYDVDGVTSSALLVSILRRFGAAPRFIVPRRMEDGYGLSRSAIDRALEDGVPRLFVALDCGTNSHEEINYLASKNVDVVIIDHHRTKENVAVNGNAILVNPHVHNAEGDEPWRNLCTVGLVFKLVHGLVKILRAENHPVANEITVKDDLDLVALGTVADLVPLLGENRVLARYGLQILQRTKRPGLLALMQVAGVNTEHGLMPVDVSFRLGPRINASGRLADAALSVELLLSNDEVFCKETADKLNEFNRERQDIEKQMTEEAEKMIAENYANDPGIVLYSDDWHPGVVGIVAGRITRKYNRPCIVFGNEGEQAKGSGRSLDGVNLVELLTICGGDLSSWGGHPMAIGISIEKEKLGQFRKDFVGAITRATGGKPLEPSLTISAWLTPEQINETLLDELKDLQPFGQNNPKPLFGVRSVVFDEAPQVFKDHHFRFYFEDGFGRRLYGVAWKMADKLPPKGVPVDLVVDLAWNYFRGRKLIQLELHDWRLSE